MLGRTRKRQLWESSHTVSWYLNFVSKYVFARFFSSNISFTLFLPWIYRLHFSPDMPFYLQILLSSSLFLLQFQVATCVCNRSDGNLNGGSHTKMNQRRLWIETPKCFCRGWCDIAEVLPPSFSLFSANSDSFCIPAPPQVPNYPNS